MTSPLQPAQPDRRRRRRIALLAAGIALLFGILFSLQAFNLEGFLRPDTNTETLVFFAISSLIVVMFLAFTFVLARTLLKLYADRQLGILGSRFRTRMVVGALLLSLVPVSFMFIFSRGLLNRSLDKWFSRPVEEVKDDTAAVASLLAGYAATDAAAEAESIARAPETQRAFQTGNFAAVMTEFRRREPAFRGGFGLAIQGGEVGASFRAPATWEALRSFLPRTNKPDENRPVHIGAHEYMFGRAEVGSQGYIVVGLRMPAGFSETLAQVERSRQQYLQLSAKRKLVTRIYLGQLLLLTVVVLFATTWFALFLSKIVTRPVAALAQATQELSAGRFDYRVEVSAADELGTLVQSFNHMAEELQASRQKIEASSRDLADANTALEQRRRQIETILESTPTGVLSLDAQRRVTHTNSALLRMFPDCEFPVGTMLENCFPEDVVEELVPLLRKSDRMGIVATQTEMRIGPAKLDVALNVSSLHHERHRLGYVLVFEDLSELLRAQRQMAWREVARRVAHEIKNPLTPIALSAERIRRHLERGSTPDPQSLAIIHGCAETIGGAVETVRRLVDEFSTLARFPASQPRRADINEIVNSALAMFDGRLGSIEVRTRLAPDLPPVLADPEAIKRAVANLVDNAAEAMQDSILREIFISTALLPKKEVIEIVVADTGQGVSAEVKEKLFLPYFSTKRRGTGLGLAIVSRIIEDHHGAIRVEENKPLGARFIVELPVAVETGEAVERTATHNA